MLGQNASHFLKNKFDIVGTFRLNKINQPIVNMVEVDITNYSECRKLIKEFRPDAMIHCAALTDLDFCENNKSLTKKVNIDGTVNILKSINYNCHFIFISTDSVYGQNEKFADEESPTNPINYYGNTKLKAESFVTNSDLRYTILRTNIFGYNFVKKISLFQFIYSNLLKNNKINLFHDVYFTPISTLHFSQGLKQIIDDKITGLYNYSGRQRLSKMEFGEIICELFDFDVQLINAISIDKHEFYAKRPKELSISSKKISKHILIPKNVYEQLEKFSNFFKLQ